MTQPRLALLLKAGHLKRVETMKMAVKTPTLMTRTVTEERSAETRKEKSFPVPPETTTPILTTRMVLNGERSPEQKVEKAM
jgi:hypothetical protein